MLRVECRNCKLRFTSSTAARLCPDCQNERDRSPASEPRWFVMLDNEIQGPHAWPELRSLAARGTIGPDDMLTQEGAGHFVRARAVRGLFDGTPIDRPPTPVKEAEAKRSRDLTSDLDELLAGLEFKAEPHDIPVEPSSPPIEESAPAPERAPALFEPPEPTPIEVSAPPPQMALAPVESPPPVVETLPVVETAPEVIRPSYGSTWPWLGASTLFILASAFFGFQWLESTQPLDAGKSGGGIEEQEFRAERPKNAPPAKSTKDLLSHTDRLSRMVERLNRHRKEAGLAEVMLDPTLCRAAGEHAHYLARNVEAATATPSQVYAQNPKSREHTADGAKTAQNALVVYTEPIEAIERWMGRLFSRVRILAPELERVGIGFEQNAKGEWICVLDPVGGRDDLIKTYPITTQGTPSDARAVAYPALNQKNVPCLGFDRLDGAKSNLGYPISMTFPDKTSVRRVQASVMDDKHNAVEVRVSSPEQPLNANLQRATIGLHPLRPLEPGRTYLVIVNALVNDKEWRHVWRFTTSK